MATLLEQWHEKAYQNTDNQKEIKQLWDKYFAKEKNIYKQILASPKTEISGTVTELASKYDMDLDYFVGFLEGINESIKKENPIDKLKETSKVKILIEPEKLYANMVRAKAHWLYELEEWDSVLPKDTRQQIYKECKNENTFRHEEKKIYPNDHCPCGSGKKYKKCCGK